MFDNVEYIAIHFKMDVVNMYKGQSVSSDRALYFETCLNKSILKVKMQMFSAWYQVYFLKKNWQQNCNRCISIKLFLILMRNIQKIDIPICCFCCNIQYISIRETTGISASQLW